MSSLAIAAIVFACVFGAALGGIVIAGVLPENHLTSDSKDVVKLAMGLIATMAALVLGLLTGSAKSAFDTQNAEVKDIAANVIVLDRTLAHYGPETKEIRDAMRTAVARSVARLWPEEEPTAESAAAPSGGPDSTSAGERIDDAIRALSPQNESQRTLQARASAIAGGILQTRWLLFGQGGNAIQKPLLVVLVFWLSALFISFGLFAPRNATVVTILLVAAISVAGSIFLILEMNQPFTGLLKISSEPLRYALAHLGQ
jgi:hypothetical protein